jgi:hypothetical protein
MRLLRAGQRVHLTIDPTGSHALAVTALTLPLP